MAISRYPYYQIMGMQRLNEKSIEITSEHYMQCRSRGWADGVCDDQHSLVSRRSEERIIPWT